ncbi:glycerol uptake facilitator-like aquaporin [Halalkalibacter oceani]
MLVIEFLMSFILVFILLFVLNKTVDFFLKEKTSRKKLMTYSFISTIVVCMFFLFLHDATWRFLGSLYVKLFL